MLGILCVYVGGPEIRELADIQLARIRRHTSGEYRLFAAVVGADDALREALESRDFVTVCRCTPIEAPAGVEHSHYLEQLILHARAAGAGRLAILHADSFPVADDWVDYAFSKVERLGTFATVIDGPGWTGPYTAGLFVAPAFLDASAPSMLVSSLERALPEYRAFHRRRWVSGHSGTGYLWAADRAGLAWFPLERSHGDPKGYGAIYAGRLFHVSGVVRRNRAQMDRRSSGSDRGGPAGRVAKSALRSAIRIVPLRLRNRVRKLAPKLYERWIVAPRVENVTAQLLADPDAFVDAILGGQIR